MRYSPLDRLIHNLAFGSTSLQNMMADMERSLLASQWAKARAERPIFVTSLPRAGTTIVLEALHQLPGLATHTYRDMPFVLTPVLWAKLSLAFRRQSQRRERAHGDGLAVNEDSPEAFEEVLWQKHYDHKYAEDGIVLWEVADADAGFAQLFREHMRKIVALRQPLHLVDSRYLSKNNANIARVAALRSMFPDACIVVPLRHPIEHAISLYRQHQNFSQQHGDDPFVRKYMADIGHFEFGSLHRPIKFAGLDELIEDLSPESVNYWLAYWIAAFEHLATQQSIFFVSYEALCATGIEGLARLCEHLDIKADDNEISRAASTFHAPPSNRGGDYDHSQCLTDRAMAIYEGLRQRCVLNA